MEILPKTQEEKDLTRGLEDCVRRYEKLDMDLLKMLNKLDLLTCCLEEKDRSFNDLELKANSVIEEFAARHCA